MRLESSSVGPTLSLVVPACDEEENIPLLVDAIRTALPADATWELLIVDDGSTDNTAAVAGRLARDDGRLRVIRLARNYGQTAAMQAGLERARGAVVVTLDADLQNDPRDIPRLVRMLDRGYDLVAGYREHRQDAFLSRRLPSILANRVIAAVTGVPVRDNGCTLKAYRRELVDRLHLYGDQHRFIPALAVSCGARLAQLPVRHAPRRHGRSKYGLSRTTGVLLDLIVVKILTGLRHRPRIAFAVAAPISFACSLAFVAAWVIAVVAFRPVKADALIFPGAALLCVGTGFYLLMLGLLAEIASAAFASRERSEAMLWEMSSP